MLGFSLRQIRKLDSCLAETGGDYLVVPVSIDYEKVPEQSSFATELERGHNSNLSNKGLFTWLKVRESMLLADSILPCL